MSCRHHLAIDIGKTGGVRVRLDVDLETMAETCALDVADRGDHVLVEVGALLGLTRERIRQVEVVALAKVRAAGGEL